MIKSQGRGAMASLDEVEGGSHYEGLYGQHPQLLRPMVPCFRAAFEALEGWTQTATTPPNSGFILRDASADPVNTCPGSMGYGARLQGLCVRGMRIACQVR